MQTLQCFGDPVSLSIDKIIGLSEEMQAQRSENKIIPCKFLLLPRLVHCHNLTIICLEAAAKLKINLLPK